MNILVNGELTHHGVKGQKWGLRNALWYPIAAWEAHRRSAPQRKQLAEMNRAAKAERKAAKQRLKTEKLKAEIIKSKDTDKMMKNIDLFSDDEINSYVNRMNTENKLRNLTGGGGSGSGRSIDAVDVLRYIDKYSDGVKTFENAISRTNSIVNTVRNIKKNEDALREAEEKKALMKSFFNATGDLDIGTMMLNSGKLNSNEIGELSKWYENKTKMAAFEKAINNKQFVNSLFDGDGNIDLRAIDKHANSFNSKELDEIVKWGQNRSKIQDLINGVSNTSVEQAVKEADTEKTEEILSLLMDY